VPTFDRTITQGPILAAVWRIGWPTMLQNLIGGLQGIVDHVMVGRFVGFAGNAAIGVSWQIFLVVIVFVASTFTGMGILVARFAGAGEPDKVNRTVYQAFLTAIALSVGVFAPVGYVLAPGLLDLVNAAPSVQAEALPYLRILFVFSIGQLLFFMISGALRAAGDAKTPLRLAVVYTILNIALNVVLIGGLGPIPAFGTKGAAMGTAIAAFVASGLGIWLLFSGRLVVQFERGMRWRPDPKIIGALFRYGLPTGFQGIVMNVAGVLLLRFVGSLPSSAAAQAAYTVGYTQLFSLISWTSVGLMAAASTMAGQNLGAGHPDRARQAVYTAAGLGLVLAGLIGTAFATIPGPLLGLFGLHDQEVLGIGVVLLRYLAVSGLFVTLALTLTGGLQGTGDTKSPLYISIVSQVLVPLGICFWVDLSRGLSPTDIWVAIVLGHVTRALLSFLRFRQGRWASITVSIG